MLSYLEHHLMTAVCFSLRHPQILPTYVLVFLLFYVFLWVSSSTFLEAISCQAFAPCGQTTNLWLSILLTIPSRLFILSFMVFGSRYSTDLSRSIQLKGFQPFLTFSANFPYFCNIQYYALYYGLVYFFLCIASYTLTPQNIT